MGHRHSTHHSASHGDTEKTIFLPKFLSNWFPIEIRPNIKLAPHLNYLRNQLFVWDSQPANLSPDWFSHYRPPPLQERESLKSWQKKQWQQEGRAIWENWNWELLRRRRRELGGSAHFSTLSAILGKRFRWSHWFCNYWKHWGEHSCRLEWFSLCAVVIPLGLFSHRTP